MENLLHRSVTRREFTASSISALFVVMAVTMIGCGGSGGASAGTAPSPVPASAGSTPAPAPVGDNSGVIADNHGHVAVITSAQLTAGGGVALSIQGTAGHTHTVTLLADQVTQVAKAAKVSVASTVTTAMIDDGYYGTTPFTHSHAVVFN